MDNVPRESRLLVYRLCVVWGLVIGCWAVLQVTVPLILKDIVGKSIAPTWQGVFTATTALVGMLGCGITGHYSDHLGRLEFLTPWIFFFFLSSLFVLYGDMARVIYPLWFARFAALSIPATVLQAFISDYMGGHALLESFSYVGATFGISMLSSSLLCGLISWYFSRFATLMFATILSGSAFLLVLATKLPSGSRTVTPLVDSKSDESTALRSSGGVKNSLRIIYRDTLLRNLIIALSILRVGNVNTHMMIVLFVDFRLGWGLPQVSVMTGISAFLSVFFQLIGVRFVISSNIVLPVLFITLAIVPVVAMGYALAMTGFQLYVVTFLGSITTIATTIFNAKIAALASDSGVAGLALGCVGTLQNLLEIGASLFLGRLMSWSFSNRSPTSVMSGLPFLVNGALLTSVVVIVVYSHKRHGIGRTMWEEITSST
ncbi:transporter [Trypanosoma theileri]|uniref:Transporter n=1 Tax=Trypanosoma theileri TaxID=67003 RepID=A0A1X0P5H4_9TRYP|nr:transporter [Trypanosoma theileri]ORC92196.1 transporter [Trypanosoma theileri]